MEDLENIWQEVLETKNRGLIEIRMLSCLEGRAGCNKMGRVQESEKRTNNMYTEAKEVRKVERNCE